VWIYTRSGGAWTQQGSKLTSPGSAGTASQFGFSAALSADGNTAIVGERFSNGSTSSGGGTGAAWVYTRSGGTWTQQGGKLIATDATSDAEFGYAVSLSADGNTAIITGANDNNDVGAAWIYTRTGGSWTQLGPKMVGTGMVGFAYFGYSAAISADGNTAVIGGVMDNSNQGAVWIYTHSGSNWTQQGTKLVGTGMVGAGEQGRAVSISADGNTAMIGGFYDNSYQGAAWIFTRSGNTWTQQGAKLVGTGGSTNAEQGVSVSLSADGNAAMVGGVNDNSGTGAAWLYTRSGGLWTQKGAKLVGAGSVGASQQGYFVSMSSDANTAIIGAPGDNYGNGAIWAYAQPSTDATLSALTGNGLTINPTFVSATKAYTATVLNTVTNTTVTPVTSNAFASVTVNGTTVTSGSVSGIIPLNVGSNVISTVVTAQDGTTRQTYTLTVTRVPSSVAFLSNLTINSGTLNPAFSSVTMVYTAAVTNATTSITLTPTTLDATATVKVNGTTVASGSATGALALSVGDNVITTVVTAQDGTTTQTYTLTVTRAAGSTGSLVIVPVPTITIIGSPNFAGNGSSVVLTANPGSGYNYQWIKDGVTISGANSASYTATQGGSYTVSIATDDITKASDPAILTTAFAYPNPVSSSINLNLGDSVLPLAVVDIFNASGVKVYTHQFSGQSGFTQLDLSTLIPGVYILRLNANSSVKTCRIIKI
jgi:hypothetical protein